VDVQRQSARPKSLRSMNAPRLDFTAFDCVGNCNSDKFGPNRCPQICAGWSGDWGKWSEQRVSTSTAFAGGNEVRCRNLRGVRSAVRGIAQWRQDSAEKPKGPAID